MARLKIGNLGRPHSGVDNYSLFSNPKQCQTIHLFKKKRKTIFSSFKFYIYYSNILNINTLPILKNSIKHPISKLEESKGNILFACTNGLKVLIIGIFK
jgi:hypothetical protein